MALYRNIRTGVTYDWADSHWEKIPNKHHYEKAEAAEPAPPPKKKASRRKKK